MTLTLTPITVKDGAAADKPMAVYNDGTNNVIPQVLWDETGALISPATEDKQDDAIALLTDMEAKLPDLSDSMLPVKPKMGSGRHISLQTATTGVDWTAFPDQACTQLTISNGRANAVGIEVRQGGSGAGLPIPANGIMPFYGITNANQLEVRRLDTTPEQKTIVARWEA